jgi:hypothetical protein
VKRMIKVLAVALLVAVILVASISPALARPRFGQNLHDNPSCVATDKAQNEGGAHHFKIPEERPLPPEGTAGCWVVLPED